MGKSIPIHEFPPRPCPVDILESQAFHRACDHARKVLPPRPKFLPGLPPHMPAPAVRQQMQQTQPPAAPGAALDRVHEGEAMSDDDDDGLLPGQVAPGDGFVLVHDPSLLGMPLYSCCVALQLLSAKDALALRSTNRAFRERIEFLALALRPSLGAVGRKWHALTKVTKTLPTAEAIRNLERRPGGTQAAVPRALRALLRPFDAKKGTWPRLRRAADACAVSTRKTLDVLLCVDVGNVASRTNDCEAARRALGEELVAEKGLASVDRTYRMDKSFAAAACRVWCAAVLDLRDALVLKPHVCALARDRATLVALGGLAKRTATVAAPATLEDLASQATAPSQVLDQASLLSTATAPALDQASLLSTRAVRRNRVLKPGPGRSPPRDPNDVLQAFDEFARAPYVMFKSPSTKAERFELAHQPLDSPWGSALEEATALDAPWGSVDSIESQGSWVSAYKRCAVDRLMTQGRLSALTRGDSGHEKPLFDSEAQRERLKQAAKYDPQRAVRMAYTQKLTFAGREARGLAFDATGSAKASARANRRRSREIDALELKLSGAPAPTPAPAPAPAPARNKMSRS